MMNNKKLITLALLLGTGSMYSQPSRSVLQGQTPRSTWSRRPVAQGRPAVWQVRAVGVPVGAPQGKLRVLVVHNAQVSPYMMQKNATVQNLKDRIETTIGYDDSAIVLKFQGKVLKNKQKLKGLGTIEMVVVPEGK